MQRIAYYELRSSRADGDPLQIHFRGHDLLGLGGGDPLGGISARSIPVVEVVFKNKSMQQWVDEQIQDNQTKLAARSSELETLQKQLAAAEKAGDETRRRKFEQQIFNANDDRTKAESGLWAAQTAKPWIDPYLPGSPFDTLVFITVFLFIGTVIKDLFLVANNVLYLPRPIGYLRLAEDVLPPHVADGPGHLQRRRHRRPDEPIHQRRHKWPRVDALFGKLIREPLKMIACLVGAAVFQLAAPAADFVHHARGRLLDPMAGQDAQTGQPPGDGRNGRHLHHPRKKPSAASRSSRPSPPNRRNANGSTTTTRATITSRCASPATTPDAPDDRSAGHRHGLGGDDPRRMADFRAEAAGSA